MATCPKCSQAIDHLINYQPNESVYRFKLWRDSYDFERIEQVLSEDEVDGDFECPECGEVLCTHMEDAYVFLAGKVYSQQAQ